MNPFRPNRLRSRGAVFAAVLSLMSYIGMNSAMMESLESRQMMSASLTGNSIPALVETPAISMSLDHSATPNANLGGDAAGAGAAGKLGAAANSAIAGAEPYTDAGLRLADFSNYPLFSSAGPTINDVNQGATGDCYFMSALAEEAAHDPARIRGLVRPHGNGTFDVFFYNNGWVAVNVDGLLPVNSNGQLVYAGLGQGNSIWVAIMEKALCYFRASMNGQVASYSDLNTGTSAEALGDLGLPLYGDYAQSSFSNGAALASYVYGQLQQGHDVELVTSTVSVNGGLVTEHAYAIINAGQSGGKTYIGVRNPWGADTPGGQPYSWVDADTVFSQMADVVISTV